jgi:AraC-like DNA-binding protein
MSIEDLREVEGARSANAGTHGVREESREQILERFGHDVTSMPVVVESLSAAEQRASFRVGDSWNRSSIISLRSGVRLSVSACQLEPSFSFPVVQPPSGIELVISRGAALQMRTSDGHDLLRGGNTLELGQVKSPLPMRVRPTGEAPTEFVSVSMSEERLRELLGVSELPDPFRRVTESEDPCPLVSQAMTPALFRLLDEISSSDAKGASRLLWHEAKSLELIALMTDELAETARASAPSLSAHDIDRLERVRVCLLEHLEEPPTLAELARTAGFNENKLKGGFRTLFGAPVFAYLRQLRMEEARRLLLKRHLNVTEVAQRVGYANPSKFAAAFRREFGMSPSAL